MYREGHREGTSMTEGLAQTGTNNGTRELITRGEALVSPSARMCCCLYEAMVVTMEDSDGFLEQTETSPLELPQEAAGPQRLR